MAQERDKAKRQKELFLKRLEEMPVVSVLCKKLGTPKSNIYRWLQEDPEFKRKYNELKKRGDENINDLAKSVVIQNMKNGSLAAAKYWLDNKDPDFIKHKFKHDRANEIQPMQMMISVVDNKKRPIKKKALTRTINKSKNKTVKLKRMDTT